MNENRVVPLRQPDEIDDPLTEILRCGARNGWSSRRSRRSSRRSSPGMRISNCRTGASALFGTDMIPHARSRRGSGRSRCRSRRRTIVGRRQTTLTGLPTAFAAMAVAGRTSRRQRQGITAPGNRRLSANAYIGVSTWTAVAGLMSDHRLCGGPGDFSGAADRRIRLGDGRLQIARLRQTDRYLLESPARPRRLICRPR